MRPRMSLEQRLRRIEWLSVGVLFLSWLIWVGVFFRP